MNRGVWWRQKCVGVSFNNQRRQTSLDVVVFCFFVFVILFFSVGKLVYMCILFYLFVLLLFLIYLWISFHYMELKINTHMTVTGTCLNELQSRLVIYTNNIYLYYDSSINNIVGRLFMTLHCNSTYCENIQSKLKILLCSDHLPFHQYT